MLRHGEISTEADKGPFLFTLAALCTSVILAVVILTVSGLTAVNITIRAFLGLMALASGSVLFAMLTDYACVQDGILTMSYLFKKRQIAVKDIGSVRFKDDVYTVYDRKKGKAGTINALATGIDRVIGELNRNHVNFE